MAEEEDVFSSFRQRLVNEKTTPAAPKLVVDHAVNPGGYEAFGTKDKLHRFDLRCQNGLAHMLAYNYLLNVTYDRRRYGAIFLTVSGLTVTIKGRALRPIVDALKLHTCEFIQAFDPEEFDEPADPAAPYVQSIDVEVIKGAVPRTAEG